MNIKTFQFFEEDINCEFADLFEKFQFSLKKRQNFVREYNLIYQNKTTQLKFLYDYGEMPELIIGSLLKSCDEASINRLIDTICPERNVAMRLKVGLYDRTICRKILSEYRVILEKQMSEILKGDFKAFLLISK